MDTRNVKFNSIVDLIKAANEKDLKMKNKINIQIEEINKTKAIIKQFEECLKQQNEMLNKLVNERLVIKNHKNDLFKELNKLENSDDEGCERTVYYNQDRDVRFVQMNPINNDIRNDGYENINQNNSDKRNEIGYNEENIIDLDSSMEVIDDDQCQAISNLLTDYNPEPIKIDFESVPTDNNFLKRSNNNQSIDKDNFVPLKTKKRIFTMVGKIKVPQNKTSIFKDEDFIKNYSPQLLIKLTNDVAVDMNSENNNLHVLCEKGMILIYDMRKIWTKMNIGSSKKLLQYSKFNNSHYMFCENEFLVSDHLKTDVVIFGSNIISNMYKIRRKNSCRYISLENGEIWKYNFGIGKCTKMFSSHSKMKACINLTNASSLFLTEYRKVFITTYHHCEAVPELDGCVDIIASYESIAVCNFESGVCKIYDVV